MTLERRRKDEMRQYILTKTSGQLKLTEILTDVVERERGKTKEMHSR